MRTFSLRIIAGMLMVAVVAVGPVSAAPARATPATPASAKDDCRQDDSCDSTDSSGGYQTESPCKSDGRPHKAGDKGDCGGDQQDAENGGDQSEGQDTGCDTDQDGQRRSLVGHLACGLTNGVD